jgi:hypothetical protein
VFINSSAKAAVILKYLIISFIEKIKVLALLNSDFFEEISKKEVDELSKYITAISMIE